MVDWFIALVCSLAWAFVVFFILAITIEDLDKHSINFVSFVILIGGPVVWVIFVGCVLFYTASHIIGSIKESKDGE